MLTKRQAAQLRRAILKRVEAENNMIARWTVDETFERNVLQRKATNARVQLDALIKRFTHEES